MTMRRTRNQAGHFRVSNTVEDPRAYAKRTQGLGFINSGMGDFLTPVFSPGSF